MNPRHLVFSLLTLAACGGPTECKLTDPSTCTNGAVCEKVQGRDKPLCFQPVLIQGTVKVFADILATPIANAEVAAVEADGSPAGLVAKSASDGSFSLRLVTMRKDDKGEPIGRTLTLRAAAQDFLPFPSMLRPAVTVDSAGVKAVEGKPWIVASTLTDLTLAALSDAEKGRPGVSGTVDLVAGQSVLVALEGNNKAYPTAPDASGAFHVFNVLPGGGYKAQGYTQGSNYTSADVTVVAGSDTSGVSIKKGTGATATIMGSVQLATGSNGAGTSVVLVLESSFDNVLARGEVVPGLRAPQLGAANLTGAYSISGIPDGRYVVLAGFENDGNVRDPDPAQLIHLTVTGGAASANPVLKVVGATSIVSPGATDALDEIAGTPTFKWKPYPGAINYVLQVFTGQGVKLSENLGILGTVDADGNIAVPYAGTTVLKPGVLYQWRATSMNIVTPLSFTEDLRGLFVVK